MNRWTQYLGQDPGGTDDTTISLIFGQELEHAWGSFVYYSQDGGPWNTNLLGRSNAHWSFYVDSGGSPMQGHECDDVCAPPQAFQFEAETYTVGATRRDVTVEDVIAVEGPRVPAWPEAPNEFDVSFLLIKRPGEELDAGSSRRSMRSSRGRSSCSRCRPAGSGG